MGKAVTEQLFIGSRTKLARASKFIDELEALLEAFNNSSPYSARFEPAEPLPKIAIDWKGLGHEAGAVLGDAVHNLRVALDLLASELARLAGKSDRNVHFPFAASEAELATAIEKRNFGKAGTDAVALLTQFAPYRGGNELLRAVHDLDIEDKHTALLETWKTMDFDVNGSYDLANPVDSELSLDVRSITHHFSNASPLSGRPVIETLRKVQAEVLGVVDAFQDLVRTRPVKQPLEVRKGAT